MPILREESLVFAFTCGDNNLTWQGCMWAININSKKLMQNRKMEDLHPWHDNSTHVTCAPLMAYAAQYFWILIEPAGLLLANKPNLVMVVSQSVPHFTCERGNQRLTHRQSTRSNYLPGQDGDMNVSCLSHGLRFICCCRSRCARVVRIAQIWLSTSQRQMETGTCPACHMNSDSFVAAWVGVCTSYLWRIRGLLRIWPGLLFSLSWLITRCGIWDTIMYSLFYEHGEGPVEPAWLPRECPLITLD
jgi:hypothetical protein